MVKKTKGAAKNRMKKRTIVRRVMCAILGHRWKDWGWHYGMARRTSDSEPRCIECRMRMSTYLKQHGLQHAFTATAECSACHFVKKTSRPYGH